MDGSLGGLAVVVVGATVGTLLGCGCSGELVFPSDGDIALLVGGFFDRLEEIKWI